MTDLHALDDMFDRLAAQGRTARFWLRDDDAVLPTPALEQLLAVTGAHGIPLTLAVVPALTGAPLADRISDVDHVDVAVHGWRHENHAPPPAKKCELGLDRPLDAISADLSAGLATLRAIYGDRLLAMLVPPWNRIDAAVVARLPALGYTSLSTFGAERPASVRMLNTHVDLIDWHGSRGGRTESALVTDIAAALASGVADIGLLTHHLVHDKAAWCFLDRFFTLTSAHPACRWHPARIILAGRPAP